MSDNIFAPALNTAAGAAQSGVARGVEVLFHPDTVTLQGFYQDQLAAYRAKRVWLDVLESGFLLEHQHDFCFSVISCLQEQRFLLTCEFLTACGRYAFWRLTNNQSPEAQYLIEKTGQ